MNALRQFFRLGGIVGCLAIALAIAPPATAQAPADDAAPARVDPDTLVAPPFESNVEPLPRSGLGGVIIEPGMAAVDISNAVALYLPPAASISSAIRREVRVVVPLKAMCSSKCETPFVAAVS